jgi:hypothetical protein
MKKPLIGALVLAFASVLGPQIAHAEDIDICISASEKAQALRKKMSLIDARAALSQCAASTCPDQVSAYCRQRLEEVNKAIPSIVLVAKDGAGRDLTAVKLSIDGAPHSDHLDGTAIELNPGQHTFVLEAPGEAPVTRDFVLVEGERDRRENVVIGQPPPAGLPKAAGAEQSSGSGQKTAALVVGAVGVASLIGGGVLGVLSMSAHNSYEQNCGSNIGAPAGFCNATGKNGESDASMKGNLATGFLIGGGVLAAAGTVWYFVVPSRKSDVTVGLGPLAVTVQGTF